MQHLYFPQPSLHFFLHAKPVAMPGVSAEAGSGGLKAVALSKLTCQLEELQQQSTNLEKDNLCLRNKNAELQQVCAQQPTLLGTSPPVHCWQQQLDVHPYDSMPAEMQTKDSAFSSEQLGNPGWFSNSFFPILQVCDESLARQSALQLAHRQQVSELQDTVQGLKQQVSSCLATAFNLQPCLKDCSCCCLL